MAPPRPGQRVIDVGAGTGAWATALADWFGISVVAIEPSPAMRARARCGSMLGGTADALPLAAATMDGAWLSTVVHHLPDLPAAARELRRVLRPGTRVLIRGAFSSRHHGIRLFRYWPEAVAALDTFPSVGLARLRAAAAVQQGPVVDTLDLLVLQAGDEGGGDDDRRQDGQGGGRAGLGRQEAGEGRADRAAHRLAGGEPGEGLRDVR